MTLIQSHPGEVTNEVPFRDEIIRTAEMLFFEIEEPEIVALSGMVRQTHPDEDEALLRLRIINAHSQILERNLADDRYIALYGVFHSIREFQTAPQDKL